MESFNNQFATLKLRETEEVKEENVTGGGEAYLPGLDVPEKKYKGPKESEVHDGYKKVKGFRAGHTKDTGGFLYKDLWNVNEERFKEIVSTQDKDKVYKLLDLVKDKDNKLYNRFLMWLSDIYPHSYDEFRMAAGGLAEAEEVHFEEGDKAKVVKKGSPQDGKIGNVISVNNNFYTLEFKDGQKVIFHSSDLKEPKSKEPMGPQKMLSLDEESEDVKETSGYGNYTRPETMLEENYSKFKKETKTRTNEQQLHSAMKLAEKKIKEANKILEYTSQLRGELNETKAGKHTQRVMERITKGIAEAYGKMKKLK